MANAMVRSVHEGDRCTKVYIQYHVLTSGKLLYPEKSLVPEVPDIAAFTVYVCCSFV